MKKIGEYIKWYFYITTNILFVTATIFRLYGATALPGAILWQIMLSGFLTTIVTVLIIYIECESTVGRLIKFFCHYIALCVVMICSGKWFDWLDLNLSGIIMMLAAVAAVYLLAFCVYYVIDLREANRINKRLKEKYGDEE